MLAFVNTPSAPLPVALREVADPQPAADEALGEVHAFSVNRGELFLLTMRPEGWRLGQDVAGVVVQAAADGSGPKAEHVSWPLLTVEGGHSGSLHPLRAWPPYRTTSASPAPPPFPSRD